MKRWCVSRLSRLIPPLFTASLLAGCIVMVPGHLYPVRGPLAQQSPPPIYAVTLNGMYKSGTLKATLAGGETCRGDWRAISQSDPSAASMSSDWDGVYGAGFFVANVLGNPVFAGAVLNCSKGSVLTVQFYDPKPGNPSAAVGVAHDNSSNLYKLTF
jgi:hypothetical protein